jgi:hypothetical protein
MDRRRRQVALSFLVFGALAVGFTEWAVYWSSGVLGPCFMGTAHAGRSAGALWGALIGIPLVGAVTLTGMSWRCRFLLSLPRLRTPLRRSARRSVVREPDDLGSREVHVLTLEQQ